MLHQLDIRKLRAQARRSRVVLDGEMSLNSRVAKRNDALTKMLASAGTASCTNYGLIAH